MCLRSHAPRRRAGAARAGRTASGELGAPGSSRNGRTSPAHRPSHLRRCAGIVVPSGMYQASPCSTEKLRPTMRACIGREPVSYLGYHRRAAARHQASSCAGSARILSPLRAAGSGARSARRGRAQVQRWSPARVRRAERRHRPVAQRGVESESACTGRSAPRHCAPALHFVRALVERPSTFIVRLPVGGSR